MITPLSNSAEFSNKKGGEIVVVVVVVVVVVINSQPEVEQSLPLQFKVVS